MKRNAYPAARRSDQQDDYHGTLVPDPYRALEDVDAPETLEWIQRENELTFSFLEGIPARAELRARLTELWDFPRASTIHHRGERYFQFRNSGLQNQDVLYVMAGPRDPGRVLLDPNVLSRDGTAALNSWEVSEDGSHLAYAISLSGSDWQTWRVRRVADGQDLPEVLEWSKFSGASWAHDGSGFYYCQFPVPPQGEAYQQANYDQKVYFHRLNTPQAEDELIYERRDHPEWGFDAKVSEDGRYLVVSVSEGTDTRNRVFYRQLEPAGEMVELIPDLEAAYELVGCDGARFFFRTDFEAPRGSLVAIDIGRSAPARSILIPEGRDTLEAVRLIGGQFVAIYLTDAHECLRRFSLEGTLLGEIPLPTLGSVTYGFGPTLAGRREDREMYYLFHSFAYPTTVFRYDFDTDQNEVIFTPPIRFDFGPYVTRQEFVSARDGTRIPLFLVHRSDLSLDGNNPTLLYGYGGFNISLTPSFATSRLAWLERGGVYAVAILRGGGEYGETWHQAGMRGSKQNVFDDFIACSEWLIHNRICRPEKLAIEGRSNGGLLVGACLTQRPDLFGACLPHVGVMDMLRFHKFTIGWAWVSDYGSSEDPQEFKTLYAYSPYHNLKPGTCYPPTLVTTADHDDRVVPGHSFKFAARLQECQAGEAPVLIRVQTKAGHGAGKPTALLIEELADIYAFLVRSLGME